MSHQEFEEEKETKSLSPKGHSKPLVFYKLIVESIIDDNKLKIPGKFAKKLGDELFAVVTLSVPDGRIWHVGIEKDGSKVWFVEGWKEFIEHYSIGIGNFLIFKYEGHSNFKVNIYNLTTSEIKYSLPSQSENPDNGKLCVSPCEKESRIDDPVKILASIPTSLFPKSMKEIDFDQFKDQLRPSSNTKAPTPPNLMKAHSEYGSINNRNGKSCSSLYGMERNVHHLKNVNSQASDSLVKEITPEVYRNNLMASMNKSSVGHQEKISGNLHEVALIAQYDGVQTIGSELTKSADNAQLQPPAEEEQRRRTGKRTKQGIDFNADSSAKRRKETEEVETSICPSPISWRMPVTMPETKKTIQTATTFRSNNPFCSVTMRASSLKSILHMPSYFARWYLAGILGFIKLEVSGGRQWAVRVLNSQGIKLSQGWTQFVRDNNLVEGDVCFFELIRDEVVLNAAIKKDVVLKVTIFRHVDYGVSNQTQIQAFVQ